MTKVQKVNKSDDERILLTETLPYEVPILFSNTGIYKLIKNNKIKAFPSEFSSILYNKKHTEPYSYSIVKDANSSRKVSIPHPAAQISFIQFYAENHSIITALCSRSTYSLRAPTSVAKHFTDKKKPKLLLDLLKEDQVETNNSESDAPLYAPSFFRYSSFPLVFLFYDSYTFSRLERKYQKLLKFDISKCFLSIYSHSITWAVKNKRFVKENMTKIKRSSVEGEFDRLMMQANSNQTNGILIGPEFSRIFAEIILQRVDQESKIRIENELHEDFSIKRYVDDYFVFTHSEETANLILKIFSEELEKFNLHLNQSKINYHSRPFTTPESIAKDEAKILSETLLQNFPSDDQDGDPPRRTRGNYGGLHLNFIKDYKALVKRNGVQFEPVTNVALSVIRDELTNALREEISSENPANEKRLSSFLSSLASTCFYLFSMDPRYRPSYLVSQIVELILKFTKNLSIDLSEHIKKTISDEIVMTLRSVTKSTKSVPSECLNLLILHRGLGERHLLSEGFLISLFRLDDNSIEEKTLDYFSLMTSIYYSGAKNSKFTKLIKLTEKQIANKFEGAKDPLRESELFHIFVDSIRSPFVTEGTKEMLLDRFAKNYLNCKEDEKTLKKISLKACIERNEWFFNWDDNKSLFYHLLKKELKSPSSLNSGLVSV
ncbi:antiviral reverse transcriptase Drt3b [Vreelandella utahensis]|uniref:antiviral reverse transcriptase Drt3b n=1 Tax=Vreelandella halophila TaxID=86177 RepID=UPI0009868601|nr:antiviral reverse transcriptase Drt3b [Halomonas utahensis]